MTKPYSEDLRERIVRAVEAGDSRNAVAKRFAVSVSFVVKLMQRWRQQGSVKPDQYGGWRKASLAPHADRVRALVAARCDVTIKELCALLAAEGIAAKRSTLGDFLLAQGLNRKKRRSTPSSGTGRTWRRRGRLGVRGSRR
jgi:putative transposase